MSCLELINYQADVVSIIPIMDYVIETKICSKCGISKSSASFSKHRTTKDGLANICKICFKTYRDSLNYTVSVSEKKCKKCNIIKSSVDFINDNRSKDGLRGNCRECCLSHLYNYRRNNKEKMRQIRRKQSYKGLRYGHAKNKAINRGIEWLISKEDFNTLSKLPCTYCGEKIVSTGSGLDRKNNDIGYTINNVVPCCSLCNTMKLNYWTYDEMLRIGQLVRELRAARGGTLPHILNM